MANYRRIGIATIAGALLGILCIIGVGVRIPGGIENNIIFLIGMWYNRVIMGLLIGFAGEVIIVRSEREKNLANAIVRGLVFGILVSSAIFLSSEFRDFPALLAGFAYGVIIDIIATYME